MAIAAGLRHDVGDGPLQREGVHRWLGVDDDLWLWRIKCGHARVAVGTVEAIVGCRYGAPNRAGLTVFAQIARGEVPPETTCRILAAQLEQDVTTDFVAAGGEVSPGIAERTSALGAGLGIRHRERAPPPKLFVGCSIRLVYGWLQ